MHLDDFAAVTRLQTAQELLDYSVRFTRHLEFESVTVIAVQDRTEGESVFHCVDNASAAAASYRDDFDVGRQDPVMQHCKGSHVPIVWDWNTYQRADKLAMWEQQAPFGFFAGIAVAMHLPNGQHLMVGVDRDQALPAGVDRVTRLTAELQLFTAFAMEASLRVLLKDLPESQRPKITPRELEVLRWTMEGKTAWELGRILGISEQTAFRHINNATRKLQCVNKTQAVMRALRLGLIR